MLDVRDMAALIFHKENSIASRQVSKLAGACMPCVGTSGTS